MSGKKGMKHYPKSLKEKAVRMHLEEGFTNAEVTQLLGINDPDRIKKWCATYRKHGVVELLSDKPKGRPRKQERSTDEQLQYELKKLKMENELLRNFLFEATRR